VVNTNSGGLFGKDKESESVAVYCLLASEWPNDSQRNQDQLSSNPRKETVKVAFYTPYKQITTTCFPATIL
jgi:hypothetical protein